MKNLLYRLAVEEDGPTAVEYAVMLGMIVAVVLTSVQAMSNQTAASFERSAVELQSVLGP